jgi:hypothetical protein
MCNNQKQQQTSVLALDGDKRQERASSRGAFSSFSSVLLLCCPAAVLLGAPQLAGWAVTFGHPCHGPFEVLAVQVQDHAVCVSTNDSATAAGQAILHLFKRVWEVVGQANTCTENTCFTVSCG